MTTEDDFHAALDRDPDDHLARLVFADWLQDQGDPRADGYRALGRRRRYPQAYDAEGNIGTGDNIASWSWWDDIGGVDREHSDLFRDWFNLLKPNTADISPYMRKYATRREAEDAAALVFLMLPAKRRAQLLAVRGSSIKPSEKGAKKPTKTPKKTRQPAAKKPKRKGKK